MTTKKIDETTTTATPKQKRGFALISPERVKEIAALGGKKAHELGTAHRFTAEEAKVAGTKGGKARHRSRGKAPTMIQASDAVATESE